MVVWIDAEKSSDHIKVNKGKLNWEAMKGGLSNTYHLS